MSNRRFIAAIAALLLFGAAMVPVLAGPITFNANGHHVSYTLLAADLPNHSAALLTSGTLGLARGGTAVDGTAQSANCLFAGPSSGGSGNLTCRTMVLADGGGQATQLFFGTAAVVVATSNTVDYVPPGTSTATALTATAIPLLQKNKYAHVTQLCCGASTNALAMGGTVTYQVYDLTTTTAKSAVVINAAAGVNPQCDTASYAVASNDTLQLREFGSNTVGGGTITGYFCQADFTTF